MHILADDPAPSLTENTPVTLGLDWERRYRHMRMHTCLHLLGALLPYAVTGGNISSDKSRLDFDMEDITDSFMMCVFGL